MRAWRVEQHGGVDALQQRTLDDPQPAPGQVLVQIKACAVNHLDLWVRRGVPGHRFPLPLIPGSDIAGVVRQLGAGVEGIAPGDPVIVSPGVSCGHCMPCLSGRDQHCKSYGILGEHRDGGYAELIAVPSQNICAKPAALSFSAAAAVGVAFLTAWHMLVARAAVKPGEWVLVQAAGSGVSSAAIQIARLWGARVIATSSSREKLRKATDLGAEHALHYADEDVAKRVKAITAGHGADVVVEHVGAKSWEGSLRALAWQGRLVTCGATTGADVRLNLRHLFFKAQSLLGSTMGSKGEFREVLEHVAAGRLRPVVDRVLPMAEAREAHRLIEAQEVFGKVVLAVD